MVVARVPAVVLLCSVLGWSGCNSDRPQAQARGGKRTVAVLHRNMALAVLQPQSITIKQSYKYRVSDEKRVFVNSPVEGRLAAVFVKEGQAVKRGDRLFQVGPPGGDEAPEAADRDKLVSLEAPCDGLLVGGLPTRLGDPVARGATLVALTDGRTMSVEFDMPERRCLALMSDGHEDWRSADLELILADGGKYPHIGRAVDTLAGIHNETGDITFVAEFPNPDGVLRPGQVGLLSVNRVLKDAIIIPQTAVFEGLTVRVLTDAERLAEPGKVFLSYPPELPIASGFKGFREGFQARLNRCVYVVDQDHVAHRREVVIQDDADDFLIIKEGVAAGDRIVLDEVGQIRDGDQVE